mmetsp:Transcript_7711/g.17493  ORF Transcript_7711/g.17493 Transcript_7711/m.17493 type:complete len:226 (-) Transcript_7711:763-1440(-)
MACMLNSSTSSALHRLEVHSASSGMASRGDSWRSSRKDQMILHGSSALMRRPRTNILRKRSRQRCSCVLSSISAVKVSIVGFCSRSQFMSMGTGSPVTGSTCVIRWRGSRSRRRRSSELVAKPGSPICDMMLRTTKTVCRTVLTGRDFFSMFTTPWAASTQCRAYLVSSSMRYCSCASRTRGSRSGTPDSIHSTPSALLRFSAPRSRTAICKWGCASAMLGRMTL